MLALAVHKECREIYTVKFFCFEDGGSKLCRRVSERLLVGEKLVFQTLDELLEPRIAKQ